MRDGGENLNTRRTQNASRYREPARECFMYRSLNRRCVWLGRGNGELRHPVGL
jgi:hypothetical protein